MSTSRLASSTAVFVLAASGVLGLAGTASAEPTPGYDPTPACTAAAAYPAAVAQGDGRGLSDTTLERLQADVGATSGCLSFPAGSTVQLRIVSASQQFGLGSATVDEGGNVSVTFDTPECIENGDARFEFTGGSTTVSIPFEVVGGSTQGCVGVLNAAGNFIGQNQGGTGGGNGATGGNERSRDRVASVLPRTGDDTLIPLGLAGVALVAAGSGIVASARRRRGGAPGDLS